MVDVSDIFVQQGKAGGGVHMSFKLTALVK
jgi:hypothetical protein